MGVGVGVQISYYVGVPPVTGRSVPSLTGIHTYLGLDVINFRNIINVKDHTPDTRPH